MNNITVDNANYELIQAMMQIIRGGGLGNGGTNFDAKTRRNSTDLEDIFVRWVVLALICHLLLSVIVVLDIFFMCAWQHHTKNSSLKAAFCRN